MVKSHNAEIPDAEVQDAEDSPGFNEIDSGTTNGLGDTEIVDVETGFLSALQTFDQPDLRLVDAASVCAATLGFKKAFKGKKMGERRGMGERREMGRKKRDGEKVKSKMEAGAG